MTSTTFTRAVLLLLGVPQLLTGLWAVSAPRSFYDDFPGFGPTLVAVDGPYNAHLVTDAGAGFLATAAAVLLAAVWLRRSTVLVALVAYLAHAVPHALYHVRFPAADLDLGGQLLSAVPLVLAAGVAVVLLVAWLRGPATPGDDHP